MIKEINTSGDTLPLMEQNKNKKSKFWAYFWWLFGGIFGAHHFYLERDAHAFICLSTIGGYFGVGWLRDLFKLSSYVDDANNEPNYIERFKLQVKQNKKPSSSTVRFIGQIITGYLWAELIWIAIPQDELYGINFRPLIILIPAAIALGVWVVGNVGREQGTIWAPMICAYATYPTMYYIADDNVWLSIMVVSACLGFDTFSKQWRLKPRKKRSLTKRCLTLFLAIALYLALLSSYFYFNAVITDSDGEEIKLSEAVKHFFTSPMWLDFKSNLWVMWDQMKQLGFWGSWREFIDLFDPHGEINAYRVLGLSQTASQSEVTAKWRSLSKEHHPDKVKGTDEARKAAQERFMEIQQAYEILSSKKNRRTRKNRKSKE